MLVLSRRVGESIVIDGNILLTVTEVRGERVRIGVEAPPHVVVDRQEIHQRRKEFAGPLGEIVPALAKISTNGTNRACHAK
jgi:carbon storage regulator